MIWSVTLNRIVICFGSNTGRLPSCTDDATSIRWDFLPRIDQRRRGRDGARVRRCKCLKAWAHCTLEGARCSLFVRATLLDKARRYPPFFVFANGAGMTRNPEAASSRRPLLFSRFIAARCPGNDGWRQQLGPIQTLSWSYLTSNFVRF